MYNMYNTLLPVLCYFDNIIKTNGLLLEQTIYFLVDQKVCFYNLNNLKAKLTVNKLTFVGVVAPIPGCS